MSLYKHKYQTKAGTVESSDWYFRFNRDGKTYTGSTGTSNKTQAAKFEDKKKQEVNNLKVAGDSKRITIEKALQTYEQAMNSSGEKGNIKSRVAKLLGSTTDKKTRQPRAVWGLDGNRYFDTLTDADVQQLVLARRAAGSADGTILTELATLSQTIKLLKKLGFQIPNIDFATIKHDSKVRPGKGRLRYLSLKEEQAFLDQLDPHTEIVGRAVDTETEVFKQRQDGYDLATLLLDIGGRYTEVASLRWKDIDLNAGVVHLWRNKVRNESVLGLTKRAQTVLQRRFASKRDDQEYVFESEEGEVRNYAPKVFQNAFRRAGLANCTIHTLRHTFASKLVQNDVTVHELAQLLGHSSTKTTEIYAHLAPSQATRKAVDILNRL